MDIYKQVSEIKQRPGFTENVGMLLIHNGVVRGWSRQDRKPVHAVTVTPDRAKMQAICQEFEQRPGIFAIAFEAASGECQVGDDLLSLVVAGDVRENVIQTLTELLNRVKSEAVMKEEHFS